MLGGQVVNPVRQTAQVVLAGEAVEQAGAEERRVGVVDQANRAGRPAPADCVGFSRSVQVTFSGSRVARRRQETSSPNQTVASLHSPRRLISSISHVRAGEMLGEVAGRAELDRPGGDLRDDRVPEIGAGAVIHQPRSAARDRRPAVGVEVNPGAGGNRERLGPGPDREDSIGDAVHCRVITDPPAHSVIEIDGQDVRPRRQCERIAADARAEVDDQSSIGTGWLCDGRPARRSPVRRPSGQPTCASLARISAPPSGGPASSEWRPRRPRAGRASAAGPAGRGRRIGHSPISSSRSRPARWRGPTLRHRPVRRTPSGPGSGEPSPFWPRAEAGPGTRMSNADSCENSDREFDVDAKR